MRGPIVLHIIFRYLEIDCSCKDKEVLSQTALSKWKKLTNLKSV